VALVGEGAYDVAALVDLLIGVVPIANTGVDPEESAVTTRAVAIRPERSSNTILAAWLTTSITSVPQFKRTDINFPAVPPRWTTSNPFSSAANIPSPG